MLSRELIDFIGELANLNIMKEFLVEPGLINSVTIKIFETTLHNNELKKLLDFCKEKGCEITVNIDNTDVSFISIYFNPETNKDGA